MCKMSIILYLFPYNIYYDTGIYVIEFNFPETLYDWWFFFNFQSH